MAVEVESSGYIYYPRSNPSFSHNPLHDLESLWWVGVWFLLYHYKPASNLLDNIVQRHLRLIKMAAQSLFNNGANLSNRHQALISQDILTTSNPRSFPKAVQHLVVVAHRFRAQLVEYYKNYKPHDRSFFTPDIHCQCGELFERAMESLKNDNTELWLLDSALAICRKNLASRYILIDKIWVQYSASSYSVF